MIRSSLLVLLLTSATFASTGGYGSASSAPGLSRTDSVASIGDTEEAREKLLKGHFAIGNALETVEGLQREKLFPAESRQARVLENLRVTLVKAHHDSEIALSLFRQERWEDSKKSAEDRMNDYKESVRKAYLPRDSGATSRY